MDTPEVMTWVFGPVVSNGEAHIIQCLPTVAKGKLHRRMLKPKEHSY